MHLGFPVDVTRTTQAACGSLREGSASRTERQLKDCYALAPGRSDILPTRRELVELIDRTSEQEKICSNAVLAALLDRNNKTPADILQQLDTLPTRSLPSDWAIPRPLLELVLHRANRVSEVPGLLKTAAVRADGVLPLRRAAPALIAAAAVSLGLAEEGQSLVALSDLAKDRLAQAGTFMLGAGAFGGVLTFSDGIEWSNRSFTRYSTADLARRYNNVIKARAAE
ncbi:MAG: hypothetical protein AAF654_01050 [Myxococcota bacterium]